MLSTFLNVRTQPLPLPTTARTAVVFPILTPALATATATTTSPKSQPEHETLNQANDNSHSDSFPVFAHRTDGSDSDDEIFGPRGGAASAMSGVSWKGSRHSGYVQAQMKKAKNEGGDERLFIGDRRGVAKAAEVDVNSRLGGVDQPQQARREGKERTKDEEREGWIALDLVNDNGSFKFSYIHIFILTNPFSVQQYLKNLTPSLPAISFFILHTFSYHY